MGIYISFVGGGSMYPPDFAIPFLCLITDFDEIRKRLDSFICCDTIGFQNSQQC